MNKEQLLKSISSLLKKHESFLNENPEVFHVIEDRLFKAIDDYDEEDPIFTQLEEDPEYYDDEEEYGQGGYGDDMFDDIPENERGYGDEDVEEDEADQWLRENEQRESEEAGSEAADDTDVAETGAIQQEEKPITETQDWQPSTEYSDEDNAKIKSYMDQGYSEREAGRLAGVGRESISFFDALKRRLNPSEPSPKMLEEMKGIAKKWLSDARKNTEYDPKKNPILNASGKALKAHEEAHGSFAEAYNEFLNSDQLQGLSRKERRQAIREFKENWNNENPDHRDRAIAAADAGAAFSENAEIRKKELMDGLSAILSAGQVHVDDGPEGYSQEAAGGGGSMSTQAAAQMVGAEKGEGGYQANIKKDPAMMFAEKNPEVVKQLKERLKGKLDQTQTERMSAIDSVKPKQEVKPEQPKQPEQPKPRVKTLDDKGLQHINDYLVEYAPLINIVSSKVGGRNLPDHVDDGDLLTAGMHGLIDAFHTYDANKGASFKTHAGRRIEGKMRDYISAGGPNTVDKYFYNQVRKLMGTNNPQVSMPADATAEGVASPQEITNKKPEGVE